MISKIIASKFAPKILIVLVTLLFAAVVTSIFLFNQNGTLKADIKDYDLALMKSVEISNKNEVKHQEFKKEVVLQFEEMKLSHEKEIERTKYYAQQKGKVENAKKEDDAIIAPVLNDTLKWLQQQQTANTNKNTKVKHTR